MTYELSLGIYASVWGVIFGTVCAMAIGINTRLRAFFEEYVDRVDRKNADLGLDRSVDAADIAKDLLLPRRGEHIDRYVERNDYPRDEYVSELKGCVGRPTQLLLFSLLFGVTFLSVLSGPLVYHVWGQAVLAEYIGLLLVLIAANILAYFVLSP